MPRPQRLAYKDLVADRILAIIGDGKKPCRQIASEIGMPDKTTYRHLRYMDETLGIVLREQVPAANGGESKLTLWGRGTEEMVGEQAKRVIRSDWPRGEHGRDPLVAALFGAEQYSGCACPCDVGNLAK